MRHNVQDGWTLLPELPPTGGLRSRSELLISLQTTDPCDCPEYDFIVFGYYSKDDGWLSAEWVSLENHRNKVIAWMEPPKPCERVSKTNETF